MPDQCTVLQEDLDWHPYVISEGYVWCICCNLFPTRQAFKREQAPHLATVTWCLDAVPYHVLSNSLFPLLLLLIRAAPCGWKEACELSWLSGVAFYLPAFQFGKKETAANRSSKGSAMPWVVFRTEVYFRAVPGIVNFRISLTAV